MDPKLVFWTASLTLMGGVVACAALGIARRRRGDMQGHRRAMLSAAALVGLFLLAYLLKVALVGHEQISDWSDGDRLGRAERGSEEPEMSFRFARRIVSSIPPGLRMVMLFAVSVAMMPLISRPSLVVAV